MSKKFNIHEWQDKQKRLEAKEPEWLDRWRKDNIEPRDQDSISNNDIMALQKVVGDYSLNKILNTIAVIADRMGKTEEGDIIKKLANQIQDFSQEDPRMDPAIRSDFDDPVMDENTTGTGASFNAGEGMGYFGKKKKVKYTEASEELGMMDLDQAEDEIDGERGKARSDVKRMYNLITKFINNKEEYSELLLTVAEFDVRGKRQAINMAFGDKPDLRASFTKYFSDEADSHTSFEFDQ